MVRIMRFPGGFSGRDGLLQFDVSGVLDSQHDLLDVSGFFDLVTTPLHTSSTIEFNFSDYVPHAGDTFDFIDYGSLGGYNIPNFTYTGLAPGFLFSVTATSGSLRFTALNDAAPTPEPALIILAPLLLLCRRGKRQ
jgi:hypothetical protein